MSIGKNRQHIFLGRTSRIKVHSTTEQNLDLEDNDPDPTRLRRSVVQTRKGFISASIGLGTFLHAAVASAQDDESDMTTQLFNPDGSLKEGSNLSTEATFRSITTLFPDSTPPSGNPLVATDDKGIDLPSDVKGTVKVTYKTPEKWSPTETSLYTDTTNGVNLSACDRVQVYQTSVPNSKKVLEKATTVGVAKSLMVPTEGINANGKLLSADLVAGRKREKDDIMYWDFDLAVAPETCGEGKGRAKEDLGLGFCPYENIVLLSAAMVNDILYVVQVECGREQWRRSNADLKRLRESFTVEV